MNYRWGYLASALASLAILAACNKKEPPRQMPPAEVTAVKIELHDVPAVFQSIGNVQSSHLVDIRSRVEGYLDKIAYDEGSFVQEGTLLFQIDPRPFQAVLDSVKAELAKQEAILWNATQTRKRMEPLYKQHAASQRDLDNAIAAELAAQASVEAAKADVRKAEINLEYTTIRAPIAGITSAANYREGSLITSYLEKPLTTVAATDPIWVNFSISESEILKNQRESKAKVIKNPQGMKFKVELTLADNSIYPYRGDVDFAEPAYNQQTGTISVRTTFPNPHVLLKPSQFVQVKVFGATYQNVFIIPQKAVLQGNNGMFVYLVGPDKKAEMGMVEIGDWWGDYWIVTDGLKAGDVVVVDGINKIQVGSPLVITKMLTLPQEGQQ